MSRYSIPNIFMHVTSSYLNTFLLSDTICSTLWVISFHSHVLYLLVCMLTLVFMPFNSLPITIILSPSLSEFLLAIIFFVLTLHIEIGLKLDTCLFPHVLHGRFLLYIWCEQIENIYYIITLAFYLKFYSVRVFFNSRQPSILLRI